MEADGPRTRPKAWGTAMRAEYEGKGLMRTLARCLVREAKLKGYYGVQIECAHNAVEHSYMHPGGPLRAEAVGSSGTGSHVKENEDRRMMKPSGDEAKQVDTQIYGALISLC